MDKLTLLAVLVCAALVACEPRGTPPKPKTNAERAAGLISSYVVPDAESRE